MTATIDEAPASAVPKIPSFEVTLKVRRYSPESEHGEEAYWDEFTVTAHGTVMAYVLPTLVAMGFGYAISELALKRPLVGLRWAWAGFGLVVAGTVLGTVR